MKNAKRISHGMSNEVNKLNDGRVDVPTLFWDEPKVAAVRSLEGFNVEISMRYGIVSHTTYREHYSAIFKTEYSISANNIDTETAGEVVAHFKQFAQEEIQGSPVIRENIDGSMMLPSIAADVPQNHLSAEMLRQLRNL